MQTSTKWATPHQLSTRWGCSRATVLRAIKSGELPSLRLNKRVLRVNEADADALYTKKYSKLKQL
jgi:excisionase family DNA binding protein